MVKRGMVGLIAGVVIFLAVSRAISLAQWPGQPLERLVKSSVTTTVKTPDRLKPPPGPWNARRNPIAEDPMAEVDSFLDRNRKEADEAIKSLSAEAETLKARLQKVEAALARWQAVAGALNEGNPSLVEPTPGPAGRVPWRQPELAPAPTQDVEGPPPGQRPVPAPVEERPPSLPESVPPTAPEPDLRPVPAPEPGPEPTPEPVPSKKPNVPEPSTPT